MSFIRTSRAGNKAPQDFTLNKNSIQAEGLVGWYPLTDRKRGFDLSGRGHNATGDGPIYKPNGTFNNITGLFTPTTDTTRLDIENTGQLNFGTGDFAISARLRKDASGTTVAFGVVDGNAYWIGGTSTTNVTGSLTGGNLSATIVAGSTNHVYMERAGGVHRLYVNGLLKDDNANTNSFSLQAIGIGYFHGASFDWPGLVFDARIYNKGRTAAEIWDMGGNPQTQWELFAQQDRRVSFSPEVVAVAGNPWYYYAQM